MALGEVLSGIGAAMSGIGAIGNLWQGYKNYQLQSENLDYQKSLQQTIFDREDTSLQRRMADAQAAGLNPYSVINSGGANAGSVVKTDVPQLALKMNGAVDAVNTLLDIQSRYFNTQQAKANAENAVKSGLVLDQDITQKGWQNKLLGNQFAQGKLSLNNMMLDSLRHTAEFNYDFGTNVKYLANPDNTVSSNMWYDVNSFPEVLGKSGSPWFNRNWYLDKDVEINNFYNQEQYYTFDNWYRNYMMLDQANQSSMLQSQRDLIDKQNSWYNWNQGFGMATDLVDSVTGLLFKKLDFGLRSADSDSLGRLRNSQIFRNYYRR